MSSLPIASEERLSLSFSRGFALYRSGVQVVLASALAGQEITKDELLENTTLGTVQAEAMPRYAERCGLLDENKAPTLFGELASQHDESLALHSTQWLMHYYLSAPHRFAPNYWHQLAAHFDCVGEVFSTGKAQKSVGSFALEIAGKEPSERTTKTAASAFISTYSREDALGQLGFLESQDQSSGQYLIAEPHPIGAGAFACVLVDYWDANWGARGDILLSELAPLARLLRAQGTLGSLLKTLEKAGLIVNQRRVSPFGVRRLWEDSRAVWREHLYA